MARASRSNKKQPDFDPSELEDLIFSPAVGKGVGSHLVRTLSTVVTSPLSTVDASNLDKTSPLPTVEAVDLTTVVSKEITPVVASDVATVDTFTSVSAKTAKLWITEHGDLITEGRVKRIRLAQDAINSAEECVYDTLWNAKLLNSDEKQSCRIVQAGYDYLVKRTRLSRKTIQRIVAKLLEKDFITVETRADIYNRVSTVYRVFSYKAVLERNIQRGRLYIAKIGPGFAFARPVEERAESNLSTVVTSGPKNDPVNMTTVVNPTTVTVARGNPTTVVKMSPYLLDTNKIDNTSSAAEKIREALAVYGPADDDAALRLWHTCREGNPECTENDVIHFIHVKGSLIQAREGRVYNPIGFLVTVVPKCLSGESFRDYREQQSQNRSRAEARQSEEEAALEIWRREQESRLSDPAVSAQEKHLIRLCLGLNGEQAQP